MKPFYGLIVLVGLVLSACGGSSSSGLAPVITPRGSLIGAPAVTGGATAAQIDALMLQATLQDLSGTARCDITVAQINYRTAGVQPGEMTNASGAVMIPGGANCPGPFPLVVYGRATNEQKMYALADTTNPETILLMGFFAAQGYAVVATDFLGYNLSAYPYHPYAHADSEASVEIDSIRAARNAALSLGLALSGKVMLSGYSQGGHSAMATQREIEAENTGEFNLVAAADLAGPYYISAALIDGVTNPINGVQAIVPFEITSWQKVYGNVYSNVSDVFNAPYSGYIQALLPSLLSSTALAAVLPTGTPDQARDAMFVSAYLTDLANNPSNGTIVAGRKQDLLGWNPVAPITLCGATSDPTVKFAVNAIPTYNDFISRGITNVALVDVDPLVRQKYAALLANDPATYYAEFHGVLESTFCLQVARQMFDQYR